MQFPPPNACENHRGHSPPRAITQEASREASANVFRKEPGCSPAPAPAPTAFAAPPIELPPPPPPPPAPRPVAPAAYVDPAQTAPVLKSKFYGAFVLNRRVVLHAIDATPPRRRGRGGWDTPRQGQAN